MVTDCLSTLFDTGGPGRGLGNKHKTPTVCQISFLLYGIPEVFKAIKSDQQSYPEIQKTVESEITKSPQKVILLDGLLVY